MLRKILLATTALVVATSITLAAGQHQKLSHAQQVALAKRITRHAIEQHMPSVIFDRNHGIPIAIRLPGSNMQVGLQGQDGSQGNDGKFVPRRNGFSNFSKSKNALFLTWFGWLAGAGKTSYTSSFSYCISYNSAHTQCLNHEHIHHSSQISTTESAAQPFTHVSNASSISLGVTQYSGTGPEKVAIHNDFHGLPGSVVEGASGTFTPASSQGICCTATTVTFAPVKLRRDRQYWVVVRPGGKGFNGRLVWHGQDSNFTHYPTGEALKAYQCSHYKDSYVTTRSGWTSYFSGGPSCSLPEWIHTSSFSFGEQQAAFSVNLPP